MSEYEMKIHSRQVKEGLFEVEGVMLQAKSMTEAIRKWTRKKQEVKVIFKKLPYGITYESHGYYLNRKDFESRNCTLIFEKMTSKTRPKKNKKETS